MPFFVHTAFRFLIGLTLSAVLFEAALRFVENTPLHNIFPVAQIALYGPHPESGYAVRPNISGFWDTENRAQISINADGYRGVRHDHINIMIIGDSYTEALQVPIEETFTERLEQRIGKTVANFGLSGATLPVHIARLRTLSAKFKPDHIVVVEDLPSFLTPDIFQDHAFVGYQINEETGSVELSYRFRETRGYKLRTSNFGQFIYAAMDRSKLITLLNERMNYGFLKELEDQWRIGQGTPSQSAECISADILQLLQQGQPQKKAQALKAFLRDLRTVANTQNIRITLILTGLMHHCGASEIEKVTRVLKARAQTEDVDIIYLDPVLMRLLPKNKNFTDITGFGKNKGQGHLNAQGHDLYARAIAEALK